MGPDESYFRGDRYQFIVDEESKAEGDLKELLHEMSSADRKEVESRLKVLLIHLLKCRFQHEKMSRSWRTTIYAQRDELEIIFDYSPSLRRVAKSVLVKAYRRARKGASVETELPIETFPEACPFSWEEIFEAGE